MVLPRSLCCDIASKSLHDGDRLWTRLERCNSETLIKVVNGNLLNSFRQLLAARYSIVTQQITEDTHRLLKLMTSFVAQYKQSIGQRSASSTLFASKLLIYTRTLLEAVFPATQYDDVGRRYCPPSPLPAD